MFFEIGLCISILGLLYVLKKTFDNRVVLSPQLFVFAGILLYLYLPALANKFDCINDEVFNLVVLCGAFGCCVTAFIFPYNVIDDVKPAKYEPKENVFKYLTILYLALLAYEIVERIISAGSIIGVFVTNRVSELLGENLSEGSSPVHMLIFEGLKIIAFFYIDMLFCKGKKGTAFLIFLAPMVHHMFTATTRFDFVAMGGALIIYLVNKKLYKRGVSETSAYQLRNKKKLNLAKIFIVGFVVSYVALFFMRYANNIRHGSTELMEDLSYSSLLLDTFKTDSDYYEFFHDLYEKIATGEMSWEYGMTWIIAPIINIIPRSLWPGKPYTSFSVRATEGVYWDYTSGNPVCTFTIFGEGYGQFGMLGCFLAPIIFLGVRWITFKQAKEIKYNQLFVLMVLFTLLTYMRAEAPIFLTMIDAFWFVVIKKYFVEKIQ